MKRDPDSMENRIADIRETQAAQPAADKATPRAVNDLIAQVKRMLEREAYHYCADCRTHCRQTIMTVEALKESERLRRARSAAVEGLEKALNNLCGFLNVTPLRLNDGDSMTLSMLTDAARAALAAVEQLKEKA